MILMGYIDFPDVASESRTCTDDLWCVSNVFPACHEITAVRVQNGIFDALCGRTDDTIDFLSGATGTGDENDPINFTFDQYTILQAFFEGNLSAGSFKFDSQAVCAINVKRRKERDYELIYTYVPVLDGSGNQIFNFAFEDNTVRANTVYSYAIFPVVNDDGHVYEQSYIQAGGADSSIMVNFDGIIISDSDFTYSTFIETGIQASRAKPASVVTAQGRKYPFVISNGDINYSTMEVRGLFIDHEGCELNFENAPQYRAEFYDFLLNGKPKLLRKDNGEAWLVKVSSEQIAEDNSDHPDKVISSFTATEIANCDSLESLQKHGLLQNIYDLESSIYENGGA